MVKDFKNYKKMIQAETVNRPDIAKLVDIHSRVYQPTDKCPCGTHKGELVDMIIYRTVPWGILHKIEIN